MCPPAGLGVKAPLASARLSVGKSSRCRHRPARFYAFRFYPFMRQRAPIRNRRSLCGGSRKPHGKCRGVCGSSRKSHGKCRGVCGSSRKSHGKCFGVCGSSRKSHGKCRGVCGSSASPAGNAVAFAGTPASIPPKRCTPTCRCRTWRRCSPTPRQSRSRRR